ncbi:hypothetical protein [Lachnoclostridium phytofermentans]|uniref:Uncharacterized protein n=1 Tax=Lachnoclostridium phytofermentans (strain ATCC 700394 / DSM 18823 / ISDg) TaxID=357809 RepID=A9KSF4_LACP7|nr:hypothetical protein [Lachnoclostridium phytofermentans]ABX43606.1 hypothetical protein Cphy_3252 [Lachnoclostridium phytofermentans ISDg]
MIMVNFLTDAYDGGNFHEEQIWITFHPIKTSAKDHKSIYMQNTDKDNNIVSSYVTKGGILCSVLEYNNTNNVVVNIDFDSESIGNGYMMIEFIGIKWDKITEILDTLPFTEDNTDSQP